jgi:lactate dehydrogenase-like 2-hydroxyacid dehydrogenase
VERINVDAYAGGKKLAERLEGFKIIIASVNPLFDAQFFETDYDVLLIARHGVGVNNIDLDAATKRGVIVTKVPGSMERDSVAEHAVTLLLQVARKITPAVEAVKRGKWGERVKFVGSEITGKNAGIVGMGEMGNRTAEILKNGFNCKILAYDPFLDPEIIKKSGAVPVDFERLLRESDIISIHCPSGKKNYHMFGKKEFSIMKKGVIIVNTARGELIDEGALAEFVQKGIIGGVGMDVLEGEPIDEKHPLLKLEKVIIVPHIAAYTVESLKKMGDKVVRDAESVVKKETPDNIANPDVMKSKNRAGIIATE